MGYEAYAENDSAYSDEVIEYTGEDDESIYEDGQDRIGDANYNIPDEYALPQDVNYIEQSQNTIEINNIQDGNDGVSIFSLVNEDTSQNNGSQVTIKYGNKVYYLINLT